MRNAAKSKKLATRVLSRIDHKYIRGVAAVGLVLSLKGNDLTMAHLITYIAETVNGDPDRMIDDAKALMEAALKEVS